MNLDRFRALPGIRRAPVTAVMALVGCLGIAAGYAIGRLLTWLLPFRAWSPAWVIVIFVLWLAVMGWREIRERRSQTEQRHVVAAIAVEVYAADGELVERVGLRRSTRSERRQRDVARFTHATTVPAGGWIELVTTEPWN